MNPTPGEDVIDSRDVISRIDDLREELESAHSIQVGEDGDDANEDFDEWLERASANANHAYHNEASELVGLENLASEAEDCGDWKFGATLVHEDYFTEYTEQMIKDCYSMPKEFESGNWPFRHMTIDYDAAADELKSDYT